MQGFDLVVTDIAYVIDRPPDPGWLVKDFVNPRSHILAYAASGRAHYQIGAAPHAIRPGALIFMPTGTPHTASSEPADPWHFWSVAFDLSCSDDDREVLDSLPQVSYAIALDLAGLFREMYAAWTAKEPGFLLSIRGTVATILYRIIRDYTLSGLRQPHTRRITAITSMLLREYDRTYAITELAELAGLSPSHFRMMFKEVTGMTAVEYQQHVKITRAIEFLTSGEHNVTETARLTGFRDVYYFSRLFKKIIGVAPSSLTRR